MSQFGALSYAAQWIHLHVFLDFVPHVKWYFYQLVETISVYILVSLCKVFPLVSFCLYDHSLNFLQVGFVFLQYGKSIVLLFSCNFRNYGSEFLCFHHLPILALPCRNFFSVRISSHSLKVTFSFFEKEFFNQLNLSIKSFFCTSFDLRKRKMERITLFFV